MKTKNKVWLILAALITVFGCLIFALALYLGKWDIKMLSTDKFETETYEIHEDFQNIKIDIDTSDIKFLPSETENAKVICKERIKEKHEVSVTDHTLSVILNDQRNWTDYISFFSFESPKITVYLPGEEYLSLKIDTDTGDIEIPKDFNFKDIEVNGSTADVKCLASAHEDIKIKVSTGDITLSSIKVKNLDLAVSTGDIIAESINCSGDIAVKVSTGKTTLTNITCKNLVSDGNTGDMNLSGILAQESFNIERSTGDIKLTDCDAAEIEMETSTGNIKGTLKTSKIFTAATNTGKVKVPETTEGGKCKLTTDTGDIIINIK